MTILEHFQVITRVNVEDFLLRVSSFISSHYQKIVDYYQRNTVLPIETVSELNALRSEASQISDIFNVYVESLSNTTAEIWELIDMFDVVRTTLLTIANSSRWLRSTKRLTQNNLTFTDYILKQGQTLESLASEIGYIDTDNDWAKIALDNDLQEEDYTLAGGTNLKVTFINNTNYQVNTVIDSVIGERVYGLDLYRKLTFENNDFKTLSYRETILQQTEILVGLIKGSVPEFPEDGISKDLLGGNVNALQYPQLIRQQVGVFEKDERYKSVEVTHINHQKDALMIELKIITKLKEVLNEQLVTAT